MKGVRQPSVAKHSETLLRGLEHDFDGVCSGRRVSARHTDSQRPSESFSCIGRDSALLIFLYFL